MANGTKNFDIEAARMPAPGPLDTPVAIVGGGLCGLALADRLHRAGIAFRLFEGRPRLGGRILAFETPGARVDLGPSWFWPGQPRIAALIADLELRAFAQPSAGEGAFEDTDGTVQRAPGIASMAGALRLAGGLAGVIEGLAARLPQDRLHLGVPVDALTRADGFAHVALADGRRFAARHVVLALPPRLVAALRVDPVLPGAVVRALAAVPTWMAGHAKFVAVYDKPFWRAAGLSGDAISRRGPLAEIHDASGPEGAPAALFGFAGVPAPRRAGRSRQIEAEALAQLSRLFGPQAAVPRAIGWQDWAFEPLTATAQDHVPPQGHPSYGLPPALEPSAAGADPWQGILHLAGTETDPHMGGLMEGALAAAARVAVPIIAAGVDPR